jgi:hypothetical protein
MYLFRSVKKSIEDAENGAWPGDISAVTGLKSTFTRTRPVPLPFVTRTRQRPGTGSLAVTIWPDSSGSAGNEHLTAVVATVLLVLLAIEGATLLQIRALLTVHAFVGMLLVPVVVLKLASTGWRMLRYYLRGEEYLRRGPPHVLLRVVVAPLIVASTLLLFATA